MYGSREAMTCIPKNSELALEGVGEYFILRIVSSVGICLLSCNAFLELGEHGLRF